MSSNQQQRRESNELLFKEKRKKKENELERNNVALSRHGTMNPCSTVAVWHGDALRVSLVFLFF